MSLGSVFRVSAVLFYVAHLIQRRCAFVSDITSLPAENGDSGVATNYGLFFTSIIVFFLGGGR